MSSCGVAHHSLPPPGIERDITTVLTNKELKVSTTRTYSNIASETATTCTTFEIPNTRVLNGALDRTLQLPGCPRVPRKTR
jgi:(p)ppGpp synthase/HD superfamily hydrolase